MSADSVAAPSLQLSVFPPSLVVSPVKVPEQQKEDKTGSCHPLSGPCASFLFTVCVCLREIATDI